MKQFQQIVNCAEIKRNAIARAKEIAGTDVNKAIKLAKKFYKQLLDDAMTPRIDCKTLYAAA